MAKVVSIIKLFSLSLDRCHNKLEHLSPSLLYKGEYKSLPRAAAFFDQSVTIIKLFSLSLDQRHNKLDHLSPSLLFKGKDRSLP